MKNALLFSIAAAAATVCSAFHAPGALSARPVSRTSLHSTSTPLQDCRWLAAAPITIAALCFSFSTPPVAAAAGDVAKGKEVFTSTCAGCHAGGQNFVKEKKTLQKEALEKFVGLDEEKVETFFKGSFVHKVVGGKLADQEITDVVTYIVDQAKNKKW